MRLLHVSDWHLGRTTYNQSRASDHERVLGEIVELARQAHPDLVVHTGDVFDGVRPADADLHRGIDALRELAAVAPVVVVCGNHDSPALFRLFGKLLGPASRITFVDQARPPEQGGILTFPGSGGEEVRLAPLPFVHANRLVDAFEDEPDKWMAVYTDRVHRIEDALGRGLAVGYRPDRHVLLFAAHLHVGGARFSGSERPIHVSDAYASRLERLPPVSYAAFGHIHLPQALPGATVTGRYAGSPIPLDFGEEGEQKVAVVVDAEPGRPAIVEVVPLSGGRPLRRLSGTLDELARVAAQVGEELCLVTVRTEQPDPHLLERVRDLLPRAVLLDVAEDCAALRLEPLDPSAVADDSEPLVEELFRDYLALAGTAGAAADAVLRRFRDLVAAVEAEQPPGFPEEALFSLPGQGPPSGSPS